MKIAIIAREFPPDSGGMESYAYDLTKAFGDKVDTITQIAKSDFSYPEKNIVFGIDSENNIEVKNNYSGIHFLNGGYGLKGLEFLRKQNVPCIATVHGKDALYPWIAKDKGEAIAFLEKMDKIIAVSKIVKLRLEAESDSLPEIEVIPHGIDTEIFKPTNPDKSILEDDMGLPIIGMVCRIVRKKNIDALIRVISQLEGFSAVIIGPKTDLDYYGELLALCSELGVADRIEFIDEINRKELPKYYSLFDLLFLASIEPNPGDIESFGICLLEAQACGIPVIASSNSDDALLDGITGLVVDAENDISIIGAIEEIHKNRTSFSKNAIKFVLEKRSLNSMIERHRAIYNEIFK